MTSSSNNTYVYVGAENSGLYRLSPGSSQWEELTNGLPADPIVPGVAVHPNDPQVIYAGTQDGPYRSSDRGAHWERLDYPSSGAPVWSFMFRPGDPSVMYCGTAPGEIYRSINGGDSWRKLSASMGSNECAMAFPTRVIALAADPNHPDEIYAALEVAGVIRSSDGGDTWDEITGSLAPSEDTLDLHGIQCSAASPHTVYITTRQGPFIGPGPGQGMGAGGLWAVLGNHLYPRPARGPQRPQHPFRVHWRGCPQLSGSALPQPRPVSDLRESGQRSQRKRDHDGGGHRPQVAGTYLLYRPGRSGVRHVGRRGNVDVPRPAGEGERGQGPGRGLGVLDWVDAGGYSRPPMVSQ